MKVKDDSGSVDEEPVGDCNSGQVSAEAQTHLHPLPRPACIPVKIAPARKPSAITLFMALRRSQAYS